MKKSTLLFILGICVCVTILVSCGKDDDTTTPPTAMTLYDSLGGTATVPDPTNSSVMIEKGRLGIRTVVDTAIFVIAADPKINSYFQVLLMEVTAKNLSGFQALSENLTDFLCVGTGAKNFTYKGLNMKDAHDPAKNNRISKKVSGDDFDQFIVDVAAAAKKDGLPDQLIGRVGAVLNTLKTPVVQQ